MDKESRYTIDDLVELTGLQRRTIRFYVEKGLLEPPAGRGRGGFYGEGQLVRLRQIIQAREEGRSLASIQSKPERPPQKEAIHQPFDRRSVIWELAEGLRLEADEGMLEKNADLVRKIVELSSWGSGSQGWERE